MNTMAQEHIHSAGYWGERTDWLIVYAVTRDSSTLERANFQAIERDLAGTRYTIERSGHWAVGWVDYLIIDPTDTEAVEIAERAQSRLEDYSILDESLWSEMELEAYSQNVELAVKWWAKRQHETITDDALNRIMGAVAERAREITEDAWPDDAEIFAAALEVRRKLGHPLHA